ncbi:MAG: hypothetical protein VCD00_18645, partial [Candidatus Hydrogenedentota bacterium]
DAVSILRDRVIPGRDEPVFGNPASVNMLIATHAVVFDVTDGVIWVSASPHQLGQFVPFGFDEFEAPKGKAIIASDPILDNGGYKRFTDSVALIEEAEGLFASKKYDQAMDRCADAEKLNTGDYRVFLLKAQIAVKQKNWDVAREASAVAQGLYVAYGHEQQELDELIETVNRHTKG